jgi:hypothetical protein
VIHGTSEFELIMDQVIQIWYMYSV